MGSAEVNYPTQNTDVRGYFTNSVGSLTPGMYNWRVKGPKFLANAGTVLLTGALTTTMEVGLMLAADAKNDNVVSATDFSALRGTFGKAYGDPGYDDRADFNGDLVVNSSDFNLLRNNFGMGGAPPIGP